MELELKWRADTTLLDAVYAWAAPLSVHTAICEMDAQYYDTADGLLARAHAGLRIRTENSTAVCCLKCGGGVQGARHLREEYECPADSIAQGLAALPAQGAPPDLCATLAAQGVFEICRVQFCRRALSLPLGEGMAELALDCGTLACEKQSAPLCEIELELKRGDNAAFYALCARLEAAFSLQPEPLSKLARAAQLRRA